MAGIEKTVFISYRRSTGAAWALAVSQNLTNNGYDVFFDYQGIARASDGAGIRYQRLQIGRHLPTRQE